MEEIKVVKEDKIKIKKDNDKKVLKKLIKTDEWEKVKDIKEIYDEIRDYDIDKEDIGLNCSKYLNKVGDSGLFEIDELYNTCYRLKALRQKRLKKEKKEKKQPKGRKGGGRGGAGNKETKETDIDKSKVNDITTKINDAINKHYDEKTGEFDYAGFFAEISGSICLNGVKNGITAISKSFKENWEKIDDIGWSGSVWNIGKNTAIELMKVVAQCPKQALGLAGFTSIGLALAFFKSVFGSIVNMVKRIGNPPSTDDDDADDNAGSGAVGDGGASGGLTRRTPQAGVLSYTADDVEANRINQQDLTQNKQSKQADLNASLQNIIKQQKENAVKQGRDDVNTILETDIQSTDAYTTGEPVRERTTPKTEEKQPETTEENIINETTEENIINETKTADETMIKNDMFRPSRGGIFSGIGFDTERGDETGKEFTGRAGGKEFLKDAFGAYSLYKMGVKAMDYMGNPLVKPQPTQVPADDGLGFVDDDGGVSQSEIDTANKIVEGEDLIERMKKMNDELDNMDKVGKGRALFLSGALSGLSGSGASKLAQDTLNPAILFLRGETENPTLKLQSVQTETEEQTNPETETLMRQMNEDIDVINSIVDNPDSKPTPEQREILDQQNELMRKAQTNITPVEEEDIIEQEEDIMDFINRQQTAENNFVSLSSLQNEIMGRVNPRATANTITDDIIQSVENRAIEEQEEREIDDRGIKKMREMRLKNMERNFQENLRPQLLSLQQQRMEEGLMERPSVQEPELDVREADAGGMSLIPRPVGRQPAEWRTYMNNMFERQGVRVNRNVVNFSSLRQLNNRIVDEYISELSQVRNIIGLYDRLSKEEGNELMKRLKESKKKK
tara:strand:+ start:3167 stop:5710 length:2544 start_codon:yes stop_codon:yes gene_type:complete